VGPFPLYKGATRAAVLLGVPLIPLMLMGMAVAVLTLLFSMKWLLLGPAAWGVMAQLSKRDDRAFRIVGLWMRTRLLNRLRLVLRGCRGEFWGASSYGVTGRSRRAWEAGDLRWGG
jgi:type IV secretion system protein VirB3